MDVEEDNGIMSDEESLDDDMKVIADFLEDEFGFNRKNKKDMARMQIYAIFIQKYEQYLDKFTY